MSERKAGAWKGPRSPIGSNPAMPLNAPNPVGRRQCRDNRDVRLWNLSASCASLNGVLWNTALIEMHAEECADLLASAALGRLAVMIDGHPEIFPVNHVYDPEAGCVTFPSNAGTKLHAALAAPSVAFEADGFCPDGSRGWSVLVVGTVEEIGDAETIARLATNREQLWRTGSSARWLRVVPSKVTGRRICNPDRAPAVADTE